MRPQTQLFPDPLPKAGPNPKQSSTAPGAAIEPDQSGVDRSGEAPPVMVKPAPIWLQRLSLFVLVLFCVYLGALVMVLPWWSRMWDQNLFIEGRPALARILHMGAVRGLISGLGMLDIWIGISEAVNYRESKS